MELSDTELDQFRKQLLDLREEINSILASSTDAAKPVQLSDPIGRLSRMDAMQQQAMASASLNSHKKRLMQISAALSRIDKDEYGYCLRCEEPIRLKRLQARPEAPLCIHCQSGSEKA